MPEISVIVPIYQIEAYLRRCVDSILAQTFTDFELILVDDGSPDNCGTICDEYAAKDARIHVIHQENGGLSAARNASIDWAFANSDSQWLSFVDSDDWVHPQMLEQLYRAVQEHGVEVSVCGYRETESDDPWEDGEYASKLWPVEQYYVECNVNATVAWGKLYHRDCFREIRYPVGRIHEDEFVTYRILFAYKQIAVIDSPMYAYFINPLGITKSKWTLKRLDAVEGLENQIGYFKQNGYEVAFCSLEKRYTNHLSSEIQKLNRIELTNKEKDGQKRLRKKLRKHLYRYRRYHLFSEKNYWIYEAAFPKVMWCYWIITAQINKYFRKEKK